MIFDKRLNGIDFDDSDSIFDSDLNSFSRNEFSHILKITLFKQYLDCSKYHLLLLVEGYLIQIMNADFKIAKKFYEAATRKHNFNYMIVTYVSACFRVVDTTA